MSKTFINLRIQSVEDDIAFWRRAENEARDGTCLGGIMKGSTNHFKLIHVYKTHRKKAQGELEYWKSELAKMGLS